MATNTTPQQNQDFFCKLSVDDTDVWFNGIISSLDFQKNKLQVFLSANHMKSFFKQGDKVVVKSLKDENELLLKGHVIKKVLSINKQALIIKIDETKNYANQRRHEHFKFTCAVSLKRPGSDAVSATLGDISLGGALVHADCTFEKGDATQVEVLANYKKPICFNGKIVRAVNHTLNSSYGIRITSIDNENQELLSKLIEFLILQRNHVAHELKMFKRFKYTVYTFSMLIIFYLILFFIGIEAK